MSLFSVYKKDLEKELKGETSGDFAKLVLALLNVIWLFIFSSPLTVHIIKNIGYEIMEM